MRAKLIKENIINAWEKRHEDILLKEDFRPMVKEYLNHDMFYLGEEMDENHLKRSIENGDLIEFIYAHFTEKEMPEGSISEEEKVIIYTVLEEELEKKGISIEDLGLNESMSGGGGAGYAVYGGGWGRSFGNPSMGSKFGGRGSGFGGSANLGGGPNLMYTYSVKPLNQDLQPTPTPQTGEEIISPGNKIKGKVLNTNEDIEGQLVKIEKDHDNNIKYYLVLDPKDGTKKKVDPTSAYLIKPQEWINPFTEDQPIEESFYPELNTNL